MKRLGLLVLLVLSGCSSSSPSNKLPEAPLPLLGGGDVSLAKCSTPKCLTIVLSPWCGYCRRATPMLLKLRDHINGRGTHVRVVIGQDKPEALREYAAVFGSGTALDGAGLLRPQGVPQFYISDGSGTILKAIAGAPQTDDYESVAQYMGL